MYSPTFGLIIQNLPNSAFYSKFHLWLDSTNLSMFSSCVLHRLIFLSLRVLPVLLAQACHRVGVAGGVAQETGALLAARWPFQSPPTNAVSWLAEAVRTWKRSTSRPAPLWRSHASRRPTATPTSNCLPSEAHLSRSTTPNSWSRTRSRYD